MNHGIQHGTALVHTDDHPPLIVLLHTGVEIHILQYDLPALLIVVLQIHADGLPHVQISGRLHRAAGVAVDPPEKGNPDLLLQLPCDLLRHLPHDISGQSQHLSLHHVLQLQNGLQQLLVGLQLPEHLRIRQKLRHVVLFQRMSLQNLHRPLRKQLLDLAEPMGHGESGALSASFFVFTDLLILPILSGIQIVQHILHFHVLDII